MLFESGVIPDKAARLELPVRGVHFFEKFQVDFGKGKGLGRPDLRSNGAGKQVARKSEGNCQSPREPGSEGHVAAILTRCAEGMHNKSYDLQAKLPGGRFTRRRPGPEGVG